MDQSKLPRGMRRKVKRYYKSQDISPELEFTSFDEAVFDALKDPQMTGPKRVELFARSAWKMGDYAYCFVLSTLWVAHHDCAPISFWIERFAEPRAARRSMTMKPSEVMVYANLPKRVRVFRGKRPEEDMVIAYTLSLEVAMKFARGYGGTCVSEYEVDKEKILALFTRRQESEVIILEPDALKHLGDHIVTNP